MQQAASATSYRRHLPIILAAAVIQGWALYGLHNVGHVYDRNPPAWKSLLSALSSGNVSAREPAWKDLWIGTQRFQVE